MKNIWDWDSFDQKNYIYPHRISNHLLYNPLLFHLLHTYITRNWRRNGVQRTHFPIFFSFSLFYHSHIGAGPGWEMVWCRRKERKKGGERMEGKSSSTHMNVVMKSGTVTLLVILRKYSLNTRCIRTGTERETEAERPECPFPILFCLPTFLTFSSVQGMKTLMLMLSNARNRGRRRSPSIHSPIDKSCCYV